LRRCRAGVGLFQRPSKWAASPSSGAKAAMDDGAMAMVAVPPTLLSWMASGGGLDTDLLVTTPWANSEVRARWAARRASGPARRRELDGRGPLDPEPGQGGAPGSLHGLRYSSALLVCCGACDSLVDLHAARRQARADRRAIFKAGDGCGSRQCSASHKPAQFARRQRSFAAALQSRRRALVRVPQELSPRNVWLAHSADQNLAIARASGF
jgi:hypothetical protein